MRLLVAVLLAWISLAPKPRPAVEFIHPRVPIVFAGLTGADVPVSIRIEPHADNRAYVIAWCDGASGHSLDGADDAAIHPITTTRAFTIRVHPGRCELTATVYGPGATQVRARVSMTLRVCGGDEECAHDPQ